MKKTMRNITCVMLSVLCVFMLIGCAAKTVEEYYSKPAAQKLLNQELDSMKSQNSGQLSDINIDFNGNDVTYNYYMRADAIGGDVATVRKGLEMQNFDSLISQSKDMMEQECGIRPSSITFAYYTDAGEKIFSVSK